MKKPVRVLVVDDSALMRKLIPGILERDRSIEVVGTAIDGHFALKKIDDLSPDVVTLDLEMPGMNGIDTLKGIMRRSRLPVIVVSSHSTSGANITLKALSLGAFDFVAKPTDVSARMPEIAEELIKKIHAAAQSAGVQSQFLPVETASEQHNKMRPIAPTHIVAIGVSTGGPNALQYVFSQLPVDFSGSILVVQHMPKFFVGPFAQQLQQVIDLRAVVQFQGLLGQTCQVVSVTGRQPCQVHQAVPGRRERDGDRRRHVVQPPRPERGRAGPHGGRGDDAHAGYPSRDRERR